MQQASQRRECKEGRLRLFEFSRGESRRQNSLEAHRIPRPNSRRESCVSVRKVLKIFEECYVIGHFESSCGFRHFRTTTILPMDSKCRPSLPFTDIMPSSN